MWTQKPDLAAEVMPHKGFNQVRVCLAYFEKVEDWPDLSAGLSSLVKAFQRVEQPFEALTVPHQAVVLKRLAQCLNPRLPAGIHVLALAAYDHILKLIGSDGLVLDLAGVLLGLLPVPAFATTQVRTQFLAIIRLHFVALGPRLSACMPGLVCSLLSGVNSSKRQDDECVHMLDELKHMMAMDCFMHCLWEAVLRDKAVRKAAMSELLDQMPLWDQTRRLASPEFVQIVVEALCIALGDSDTEIVRGALILLEQEFPMDSNYFSEKAKAKIVTSFMPILISDNWINCQRILCLLTGTLFAQMGSTNSNDLHYFCLHSAALLETTIIHEASTAPLQLARALALLFSEYEDLAPAVIPPVLLPLLEMLERLLKTTPDETLVKRLLILDSETVTETCWDSLRLDTLNTRELMLSANFTIYLLDVLGLSNPAVECSAPPSGPSRLPHLVTCQMQLLLTVVRRCTDNLTMDLLVLLLNILDQTARVINHLLRAGAALCAPSLVEVLREHSQLIRLEEELVRAISDFAPVCLQRLEDNGTDEIVRLCVPCLTQLWNLARSSQFSSDEAQWLDSLQEYMLRAPERMILEVAPVLLSAIRAQPRGREHLLLGLLDTLWMAVSMENALDVLEFFCVPQRVYSDMRLLESVLLPQFQSEGLGIQSISRINTLWLAGKDFIIENATIFSGIMLAAGTAVCGKDTSASKLAAGKGLMLDMISDLNAFKFFMDALVKRMAEADENGLFECNQLLLGLLRLDSLTFHRQALTLVKPDENLQACFAKSHLFTPLDYLDTITVLLLDKVVAFPAHKMLSIETLKTSFTTQHVPARIFELCLVSLDPLLTAFDTLDSQTNRSDETGRMEDCLVLVEILRLHQLLLKLIVSTSAIDLHVQEHARAYWAAFEGEDDASVARAELVECRNLFNSLTRLVSLTSAYLRCWSFKPLSRDILIGLSNCLSLLFDSISLPVGSAQFHELMKELFASATDALQICRSDSVEPLLLFVLNMATVLFNRSPKPKPKSLFGPIPLDESAEWGLVEDILPQIVPTIMTLGHQRRVESHTCRALSELVLTRLPVAFVETCLVRLSSRISDLNEKNVVGIVELFTDFHYLESIIPILSAAIEAVMNQRKSNSGSSIRESVLMLFVYTLIKQRVTRGDAQAGEMADLWDFVNSLLKKIMAHSREPMSHVWLLQIVLVLDQYATLKESEIRCKKQIQTLIANLGSVALLKHDVLSRNNGFLSRALPMFHNAPVYDLLIPRPSLSERLLDEFRRSVPTELLTDDVVTLGWYVPVLSTQRGNDSVPQLEVALEGATEPAAAAAHHAVVCLLAIVRMSEESPSTPMLDLILSNVRETTEVLFSGFRSMRTEALSLRCLILELVNALANLPAQLNGLAKPLHTTIMSAINNENFFHVDRRSFRNWVSLLHLLAPRHPVDMDNFVPNTCNSASQDKVCMSLKRLGFVVYASPRDAFAPQLSELLAKLSHLYRSGVNSVQEMVLFVNRILICRMSAKNLVPVWPVILSDLISVLSTSEDPSLLLAALKFVDLAASLRFPGFDVYHWMFPPQNACFGEPDTEGSFTHLLSRVAGLASGGSSPRLRGHPQLKGIRGCLPLECVAALAGSLAEQEMKPSSGARIPDEHVAVSFENDFLDAGLPSAFLTCLGSRSNECVRIGREW